MPEIKTHPGYWDCDCEKLFIHEKREHFCPDCGSTKFDQPDSRVDEIAKIPPRKFIVDHDFSCMKHEEGNYMIIDVPAHNMEVHIKHEHEGIVVDVWNQTGDCLATLFAEHWEEDEDEAD
jgi:hypothetical protein